MSSDISSTEKHVGQAVVVRNAKKRYGKSPPILNGLNMTVVKGTIYGLLGPSGCGKSTLLSCIVGVKHLDNGDIWVVGDHLGSKKSDPLGPRVGYMPQEISLVKEFSVIGAFFYFGRINGLDDRIIVERYNFLSQLLQLPAKSRLIKHMSGGQQRRVSFAAALLHQPELLILDEPTVGLDPVLRENIWQYLVKITQEQGVTVVITTHYIEETKMANRIGLMRCGQLLAEAAPMRLLDKFQCETLEEAFLTLSQQQKECLDNGITEISTESISEFEEPSTSTSASLYCNDINGNKEKMYKKTTVNSPGWYLELRKFQALMAKNILQFLRHPGGIAFALLFPLIQTVAFFNAIGRDPQGLVMAVVNEEANHCSFGNDIGHVVYDPTQTTCDYVNMSCRFLHYFNKSIVQNKYFNDLNDAKEAVKRGATVGVTYFGRNFSYSLQRRQENNTSLSTEEILASEIQVWLDMGDRQIGMHLQKKLFESFFEAYKEILRECHYLPKIGDFPVHLEQPIFGTLDQKYSTAMAPGFILTLIFFMATSVTSSIIITDRHEGVWDRSLVQGVNTAQILLAHLLTQLSVIIIQVAVTLSVSLLVFNLGCKGSVIAVILMVFLIGVCGMAYGFLISVLCSSHTVANYISTGTFYPMVLLGGSIWPIEGMPHFLRYISMVLPTTLPALSMRAILDKGYAFENSQVYSGFLVVSGWTICLMLLCHVGLRNKIT